VNPLLEIIAGEIRKNNVISCARFMELALYCPVYGYYEKEKDKLGRRGDFFTSVSVGSVFGELLAFQFAEWLDDLRIADCRLRIVEAGAHNGQLANDVLNWLRGYRTALYQKIEYCIVEPSVQRREWQRETLATFSDKTQWVADLSDLNVNPLPEGVRGIIFCNELLDAMPTHRLEWDARSGAWFEWGVTLQGDSFVWARMRNSGLGDLRRQLAAVPEALLQVLPDGFTTEICPSANAWWRKAAALLQKGRLMTLDYGWTVEEFFSREHAYGSLRAFSRHSMNDRVLENAGEQDITAHVNFSAIQAAGEAAGLKTEAFLTQEQFFARIAGKASKRPAAFGQWTSARARQFQTLTHPEHLGRAFRALIQSR
jgi:SAM-dependent MidA family methyltransferase